MKTMKIKRLNENAKLPTRADDGAAGYDLYSSSVTDIPILPGARALIPTGLAMEIPQGEVGLIWPRSGLAVKQGVERLAGVIDSSYRGEVKVCLLNTSCDPIIIKSGDKMSQIIFQEYLTKEFEEVESLTETSRGEGGFGSTGLT